MAKKLDKIGLVWLAAFIVTGGIFVYNAVHKIVTQPKTPPPAQQETAAPRFPQQIAGLKLDQVVSGPQALGMISKMHGTGIKMKQGYIAEYSGPDAQIMIWVSESPTTAEAKQLFHIMDSKIAKTDKASSAGSGQDKAGNPPFVARRPFQQGGIQVVNVKGMGMENYYYQRGTFNYWIAVKGTNHQKVLETVMSSL